MKIAGSLIPSLALAAAAMVAPAMPASAPDVHIAETITRRTSMPFAAAATGFEPTIRSR